MTLPLVADISPYMGCDPEFFFKRNGEVIGAETILPEAGLGIIARSKAAGVSDLFGTKSKFVIDGVQAELNPRPNYCRANLANELSACFQTLDAEVKAKGNGLSVDFSRAVEISEDNLALLSEKSKVFGCAPSKNVHATKRGIKMKKVDPTVYRTRAAGGHIHIGMGTHNTGVHAGLKRALTTDHAKTVVMLDILCGNTSVLIDRDAGNIERRKMYGKAGEFRLPPHGLEYRTLSNYWLTSYPLMSFAFGQARLAAQLIASDNHKIYYDAFISKIKAKNIRDAINNNDFDLAYDNFKAIESLMLEVQPLSPHFESHGRYPINKLNIKEFHHFIAVVKEKGLEKWFPENPMEHWIKLPEAHKMGFYDYLALHVRNDMNKVLQPTIQPELTTIDANIFL